MEYNLSALSIYEFGQRKKDGNPHQEDWLYPKLNSINNDKDRLFILCDGMGGHPDGEVASEAVCEAMSETIKSALAMGEKFTESLLQKAINAAYDLLDERDTVEDAHKKMGTTMTFLMLHEGGATIAHIGDSRVYHIRPKTGTKEDILFKTRDHSLVNDLIKIGELTEEEALTHPQKNHITRAMQPNLEHRCKADIKTKKNIRPGDYFYMCSDGMLEQTSDDNLCFMLANDVSDEEKRNMLIRVSKNNIDNHSAHLIHILDVQPESEIEDDPLPVAPPKLQEIEDDEDVVNPEFDESDTTGEATSLEEGAESSTTTAVEGGTETSATFHRQQGTHNNGGKRSKLMWGIIACLAVAILAIGGTYISRFLEEKVTQPPVQETDIQQPQEGENRDAAAGKTSTELKTPAKNNPESGSSTSVASDSPNTVVTDTVPPAPSQASNPDTTSHSTPSGQGTGSQSGHSNNQVRINQAGAALKNRTNTNAGTVPQSDQDKVKQANRKR